MELSVLRRELYIWCRQPTSRSAITHTGIITEWQISPAAGQAKAAGGCGARSMQGEKNIQIIIFSSWTYESLTWVFFSSTASNYYRWLLKYLFNNKEKKENPAAKSHLSSSEHANWKLQRWKKTGETKVRGMRWWLYWLPSANCFDVLPLCWDYSFHSYTSQRTLPLSPSIPYKRFCRFPPVLCI